MEYIIVDEKTGRIVDHLCGATKPEGAIEVPAGFPGFIGMLFAALKDDLSGVKPISQQVAEGLLTIPEGFKASAKDDELVRMEQDEIDAAFPPKIWAVPGTFSGRSVKKTFNRFGTFGYFPPEGAVLMEGPQPTAYHKAESDGTWTADADRAKAAELAQAKAERADAVSKITVTVDGMVFDGDERSQERMSRTITAAVATGEDMSATTTWVLADNTVAQVSITQLAQALRAAGEAQTELWTLPYETEATA